MRCPRCGNENADANRFCGMCGTPLIKDQPPSPQPVSPPAASPQINPPAAPISSRPAVPTQSQSPVAERPAARRPPDGITGPSFLGLSSPPSNRPGSSDEYRSPDDRFGSGRNLDYLLEDEEEPKGGKGKWIVGLIAVILAAGFGYLRWKQGGFDWLNAAANKPAQQTTQNTPDPNAAPASPSATPAAPNPTPSNASPSPAAPPPDSTATSQTPPANAAPAEAAPTSDKSTAPAPDNTAAPPAPAKPKEIKPPASAPPQKADADNADDDSQPATDSPKPSPRQPAAAKPTPAKAIDAVAEAERYIYGRGVTQDCDRGLHLLKPAADRGDSKAMISMGTLYFTGTCTPRDLPTSYRWFALALHKDPDNQALQDDLQKLWAQMTQPERQLAIKLSQ